MVAAFKHLNAVSTHFKDAWETLYLRGLCDQKVRSLVGHSDTVKSIHFSQNGDFLVSASADQTVRVWDSASGAEKLVLRGHIGPVVSVCTSIDGKLIASAGNDKSIKIWDAVTGDIVRTLQGHLGPVFCICLSRDGRHLVSGGGTFAKPEVLLWDTQSGVLKHSYSGFKGKVLAVAYDPSESRLATRGEDGVVRVWECSTGKTLLTIKSPRHLSPFVSFSSDGREIFANGERNGEFYSKIQTWDSRTGEEKHAFSRPGVFRTGISVDSEWIVGQARLSGQVENIVWNAISREERYRLTDKPGGTCAAISVGGDRLAFGDQNGEIRLWNMAAGQVAANRREPMHGVTRWVHSPDDRHFLELHSDHSIRLCDLDTGAQKQAFTGHTDTIPTARFSKDGTRLVSYSKDGTIRVWDVASAKELCNIPALTSLFVRVCINENGKFIACSALDQSRHGDIWILDANTGEKILTISGPETIMISLSIHGTFLLAGCADNKVYVYDLKSGEQMRCFRDHSGFCIAVLCCPDGEHIVSGDIRGEIKLWNLQTGEEKLTFRGHSSTISSLSLSPDGTRLVSGSYDRTVKMWSMELGEELLTLRGNNDLVAAACMTSDGNRIVSSTFDGAIMIWEVKCPR